ncbi:MAG: GSCFA family protein [Alphaproteobacteria bacterium]|nr:MAG: GSCFA family protein [Alphaproteobacteria bacterium]
MSDNSPYIGLNKRSYWKTAVAGGMSDALSGIYRPRFTISTTDAVVTAGSCFAQHIGTNLKKRGYVVLDAEPAPPGLSPDVAKAYGFGLYSARYGNVYTARQLRQLLVEALSDQPTRAIAWLKNGRAYDALRPSVEPNGLPSAEDVARHRSAHLAAVRSLLEQVDVFVFTLGLTEVWLDRATGAAYPTAPGTVAGSYNPDEVRFHNLSYNEVVDDLNAAVDIIRNLRPSARFIFTVSPVPLTATATDDHVLVATTRSKAILRAAVDDVISKRADCDYFPSFEIITGAMSGNVFFEKNLRSVTAQGVKAVMNTFFSSHGDVQHADRTQEFSNPEDQSDIKDSVVCEDALLDAFAKS